MLETQRCKRGETDSDGRVCGIYGLSCGRAIVVTRDRTSGEIGRTGLEGPGVARGDGSWVPGGGQRSRWVWYMYAVVVRECYE